MEWTLPRLNDGERTRLRKHRIGFRLPEIQSAADAFGHGQYRDCVHRERPQGTDRPGVPGHLSDLLSIRGRLEHRPSELSGGEQQRVAIARALITRPAIVLADEPTGNLDTKNSDAVLQMLVRSNRELGQTMLMITHNPEAAVDCGPDSAYAGWGDRAEWKVGRRTRLPNRGTGLAGRKSLSV